MRKFKEFYWIAITLTFVLIIFYILVGNEGFTEETIGINIKDTYFVINFWNALIVFAIIIFFFIYLIRILIEKFKNNISNLVFAVVNVILIVILIPFNFMKSNDSEITIYYFSYLSILLILLEVFVIYKLIKK